MTIKTLNLLLLLMLSLPNAVAYSNESSTVKTSDAVIDEPLNLQGYQSQMIELNGLSFHYIEQGKGDEKPLLILLHGFPYFAEAWQPLLTTLSRDYHVVAPDNRGYAFSDKPEAVNDYHISKLVDDVIALIDYLSISAGKKKKVTLIGHDWGGVLAWSVAQYSPQRVEQVVAINAPPYNTFLDTLATSETQQEASRYIPWLSSWISKLAFTIKGADLLWGKSLEKLHEDGHVDDAFKAKFLTAWSQKGAAKSATHWYVANIRDFDEITKADYWPTKETEVTIPALLIWSSRDKAFTQDTFNNIRRDVKHLKVEIIDTDSHAPFLDHTEQVAGFIMDYLRK